MPPRRSCFNPFVLDEGGEPFSFNATTAFLLPILLRRKIHPHNLVSMPPRRSCFANVCQLHEGNRDVSMPPRRSCFAQAGGFDSRPGEVSMPPRRSCFTPGSRTFVM